MGYNVNLYLKAEAILNERRTRAQSNAQLRRDRLAAAHPELEISEARMRQSVAELIGVIGGGKAALSKVDELKAQNLAAAEEIKRILAGEGLPEDYLEPDYTCKLCSDTGVKDGRLCTCHLELLKQLSYNALCLESALSVSSFDDFSLGYYTGEDLRMMTRIYEFCRSYAESFDLNSKSLLMCGETGLGKTHLSLAIAGEAIKKGFGVVYGSAQNLFSAIESEHFGRSERPEGYTQEPLLECDLLVLDDLGAEFKSSFSVAVLNNIITTRLLASRPTIISTNLTIDELDVRYSRRIASRLIGEYAILAFAGQDIRQLKG